MDDEGLRDIARILELSITRDFASVDDAAVWTRAVAVVYREYLRRGMEAHEILDMYSRKGCPL